jgi:hypothetical protein
MPDPPFQAGDAVEILPATAPPLGQPPATKPQGIVVAVDEETCRATVRLIGRHYAMEVPLVQLRRLT